MNYLIWGYYGFGNLGDELMLRALRDGIQQRDHQATIYVRCQRAPDLDGIIPFDVEALREPRRFPVRMGRYLTRYIGRVCGRLRDTDVLIIGGGTLFMDKGRHNRSLLELLFFVAFARALGKRVVAVGVGVDDLRHPLSRTYFRCILKLLHGAWFRETYGYEIARSLAPRQPQIVLSADLAYSLAWPRDGQTRKSKKLGIVLADYHAYFGQAPGIDKEQLNQALCSFLRQSVEEGGQEPVFLVFQAGTGFQGDVFSREILKRLGWEGKREIKILRPDLNAIAAAYEELECVVGMHYHALVLASLYQVPFVAISHERKFEDVCERFAMPCLPMKDLSDQALLLATQRLKNRPLDRLLVDAEKQLSERNFDWMKVA